MASRARSAPFVGRVVELDRLHGVLEDAERRTSATVLVGGEAGVGKTRLCEEFTTRARAAGARVLVGGCLELGEGGLPYAAVVEALRSLGDEIGLAELHRLADEDADELARLLPALRGPHDPTPPAALPLDASTQLRLFEALLGLLRRLSSSSPVVLLLEDLHWADASMRDLLLYLARNLSDTGAILLATFRSDELHRRHPLRPLLAHLLRNPQVERLDLEPFDRDELTRLLEALLGDAPGPELADLVLERSEGNAFFAEQLLAAGADRVEELPESLRDILLSSLDALPDPVTDVLRVVAAAGGDARHGLLQQVTGLPDTELDGALRATVDQGALVADPTIGTYAFRHTLLAEAVESTLLPGERGRLHTTLANALEADPRLASRSAAAELAHHWHRAGDQPRSLHASLAAAREAEAAAGVAEARRHVDRALELWPHVDGAPDRTGLDGAALRAWAAELAYLAGEPERAAPLQEQALAEAGEEPLRRTRILDRLGFYQWAAGRSEAAETARAEAVACLPADAPTPERARMLAGYSQILMLRFQRVEAAIAHAEQALALAREAGVRDVEANALSTLGSVLGWQGAERGPELLREARAIAEQIGSHDELGRSYLNEANVLVHFGQFEDAIAVAGEGLERVRALGTEARHGAMLACNVAWPAFLLGRWRLADEVLKAAPRDTGGVGVGWARGVRAQLLAARGEFAAARDELALARRGHATRNELSEAAYLRARLWLTSPSEDPDEVLEIARARPAAGDTPDEHLLLMHVHLLRALAEPQVGRALDDTTLADTVLTECRELAARFAPARQVVPAWVALAEAEHARATGAEDASERWAIATARCDERGLAYYAAYARYRQAHARLEAGRREGVHGLLHAAFRAARSIGAAPLEHDVAALAQRAGIDLGAGGHGGFADELGLTEREAEVLLLVAEGYTNAQIAERLYISEKTASVHVSNFLRKLGVANRGEAAALVHRLELTSS